MDLWMKTISRTGSAEENSSMAGSVEEDGLQLGFEDLDDRPRWICRRR
jgi:hypothetical protein